MFRRVRWLAYGAAALGVVLAARPGVGQFGAGATDPPESSRRLATDSTRKPLAPEGVLTPPPPPEELRIAKVLDEPTSVDLAGIPLAEAMAQLADRHGIPIRLDRMVLKDAGINGDEPLHCHVKGIRLRSALDLMLGQHEMGYTIRDEVLLITTREAVEEHRVTRVYDVPDLVVYHDEQGCQREDFYTLIELVETTVRPMSWGDNGTGDGQIHESVLGGMPALAISQSEDVHREVAALLAGLRRPELPSADKEDSLSVERRIEKALDEPTTFGSIETPLQELAERLSRSHAIPIFLDRKALEESAVAPDTTVAWPRSGMRLRSALDLVLRDLRLEFTIHDEVLLITSPDVVCRNCLTTRVYDVTDLVAFQDVQGRPWEDFDQLVEMLETTIHPESWADNGVGDGQIHEFPGGAKSMLAVLQTHEIHREAAGLLAGLRKLRPRPAGDGSLPVRPRPETSFPEGFPGY